MKSQSEKITTRAPEILNTVSSQEQGEGWRMFNIRLPEEVAANSPPGDQEQHYQGLCRSVSNPQRLYIAQDIGAIRRSDDGGISWKICQGKGFETAFFTGIECDPVCENVVMVLTSMRTNIYARQKTGIWRSEDGGINWHRAYAAGNCGEPRSIQSCITWAPSSVGNSEASRWYAAFGDLAAGTIPADSKFLRSYNGGRAWQQTVTLPADTFGDTIYVIKVHPLNADLIYMGTSTGLFMSGNGGNSFTKIVNIESGACTWVEINPVNGNDIFFSISGKGAYRTLNAFSGYSTLFSWNILQRARPHPADWNIVYAIPSRSGSQTLHISVNALSGSATLTTANVTAVPGKTDNWNKTISSQHADVSPDPVNTFKAFAFGNSHFFHTENRITWIPANYGHTGACWGENILSEQMFDQFNPDRFAFFHTDMGMAITTNRGVSFVFKMPPWDFQVSYLGNKSMDSGAIQPVPGSAKIIGSAGKSGFGSNKVIYSPDGGDTWTLVVDENYNHWCVAYSLTEPDYAYAGCRRSVNGGQSFEMMNSLVLLGERMTVVGISRTGTPSVLYAMDVKGSAMTKNIWKSVDRGLTWTLVATATGAWKFSTPIDPLPVFRVHPTNKDVFYTLSDPSQGIEGSIARFDTTTSTWTHYNVWQAVPRSNNNYVRKIAIDPRYPDVMYVQLAHPGMCFILRTINGGTTWTDITGDTHAMVTHGLEVHPLTGELFVGGVCGTRVLPPPYATMNTVYETLLWGNNVETSVSVCDNNVTDNVIENSINNTITIHPNPTDGTFTIDLGEVLNHVGITISNIHGRIIKDVQYIGEQLIELNLQEPPGIYFVSIMTAYYRSSFKLIKY